MSNILTIQNPVTPKSTTPLFELAVVQNTKKGEKNNSTKLVQPKLSVGAPDDPFEKEADNIADKVMRMPEQNFVERKCAHCEEEEKKIQRKPITDSITPFIQTKSESGIAVSNSLSNRILNLQGNGGGMEASTQSFMSNRFGKDFSQVKIHTDGEAIQMNRDLSAKAFTVDNDIYFNEGQYQPHSDSGKQLLAHELTHTLQQGQNRTIIQRDPILEPLNTTYTPVTLTKQQQSQAVDFNRKFGFNRSELQYLTDLFGNANTTDTNDKLQLEVAADVAGFQQQYNIAPDGKIGYDTAGLIIKSIQMLDQAPGAKPNKSRESIIKRLRRHYAPPVLYVGMNSYEKEIKGLKGDLPFSEKGQLHTVTGGLKADALESDGIVYDLTKDNDIKKFVKSLNIPDKTAEDKAVDYLKNRKSGFINNAAENAMLIKEYSIADKGYADRMTRLVLSGHSGGTAVSGKGRIVFSDLIELQKIFPIAASQVQHLMVSACTAGTQDNIENIFVKAFPNLRTVWGYYDACPLPANTELGTWLEDTSRYDTHKLKKQGGSGISIWNEGVYTGSQGLSKTDALAAVDNNEALYQQYFKGDKIDKDAYSGGLYQYYNSLRGLLGRSDLTADEKKKYSARRDQAVRLRFYHKVSEKFSKAFSKIVSDGYGTANIPAYDTLDRKQAFEKILLFDSEAKGEDTKKKEAKSKLENCLRDLSPSCISEDWIN